MTKIESFALEAKKFIAAAGSVVALLIAQGVLNGTAASVATIVIAAAGAALVYFLPNKGADGSELVPASAVTAAVEAERQRVSLEKDVDPETGLPLPAAV